MSKKKYNKPRYTGQSSNRKFYGFRYYLHSNDKLTKREREDLLNRSKISLSEVLESLPFSNEEFIKNGLISELDSNLSDIELLDQWNFMYETYGYLMSEFKDHWEKEKLKDLKQSPFKQSQEFEELKTRVGQLESEVMKLKLQLNKKRSLDF
jgi:uncharacterized small protein (DUF1192 family)